MHKNISRSFKGCFLGFILSVVSLHCSASESLNIPSFNRVISFGDSLSDMGNIDDAPVSNGSVWVDHLSRTYIGIDGSIASMEGGFNYSFAGAATGSFEKENPTPSAAQQIEMFTEDHGLFTQGDLVTLWIGGNDFLDNEENPTPSEILSNRYEAIIARIVKLGAKHILWGLMPDTGLLPPYVEHPDREKYSEYALSLNQIIKNLARSNQSKFPNISIILFDYHHLQLRVIEDPTFFGVQDPRIETSDGSDLSIAFLMSDGVHPTAKGHQIIAEEAYKSLHSYYSNRNKTDESIVIKIQSFTVDKSGVASLTFTSDEGLLYVVEHSDDLAEWIDISGVLQTESSVTELSDTIEEPLPLKGFYRIRSFSE